MDPAFTSLIIGIIVLEGIGRQLDPALDIFQAATPVLIEAVRLHPECRVAAVKALQAAASLPTSKCKGAGAS